MSETPAADQPVAPTTDEPAPPEIPAEEPEADVIVAADRLFGAFAIGVMALLVICIVLALVASRNVPAGF
ncbi:MAG: hypothetical protein ACRDJH_08670 [Thermomicrobiales bacterium]